MAREQWEHWQLDEADGEKALAARCAEGWEPYAVVAGKRSPLTYFLKRRKQAEKGDQIEGEGCEAATEVAGIPTGVPRKVVAALLNATVAFGNRVWEFEDYLTSGMTEEMRGEWKRAKVRLSDAKSAVGAALNVTVDAPSAPALTLEEIEEVLKVTRFSVAGQELPLDANGLDATVNLFRAALDRKRTTQYYVGVDRGAPGGSEPAVVVTRTEKGKAVVVQTLHGETAEKWLWENDPQANTDPKEAPHAQA